MMIEFYRKAGNKLLTYMCDSDLSLIDAQSVREEDIPEEDDFDNIDTNMSDYFDEFEKFENNIDVQSVREENMPEKNYKEIVSDNNLRKYSLKWSKNYKDACRLIYYKNSKIADLKKAEQLLISESQLGNVLAIHDLGKLYSTNKLGDKNMEKSQRYYLEALKGFLEFEKKKQADDKLYYKIGVMYEKGLGTSVDISKAIDYFKKSSDNKWSSYQLGKLYAFGTNKEIKKDKAIAIEWLTKSANDGNEYAEELLWQIFHPHSRSYKYNKIKATKVHHAINNIIRKLQNEYDIHIKKLQQQFQYENEIENQMYEYYDENYKL